jgi:hypothetical protein
MACWRGLLALDEVMRGMEVPRFANDTTEEFAADCRFRLDSFLIVEVHAVEEAGNAILILDNSAVHHKT